MPFMPFFGPAVYLIAAIGFVFIAALFLLLCIELKWQLRGVILLVLLVLSSGAISLASFGAFASMGFMSPPKEIKLSEASKAAGFNVQAPKYLPEGMKLRRVELMPGPVEFKMLTINYAGGGDDLTLMQTGMSGGPMGMMGPMFEEGYSDTKREKVAVRGRPAKLTSDGSGFLYMTVEVDGVSIEMHTSLPKEELIKVADSLTRQ
jgi:hypothetical protein